MSKQTHTHTHTHTFPTMDCLDRHPSSPRRGRSMARGWLSLLRSGTCTQKGKWCRVLGESSSDRGPVMGLRRKPDRGGEDQKPNGAGTPRTRPDETKDRQARQQAKGGRKARRRDERTSTRAGRQARRQASRGNTHTHTHFQLSIQ